MTQTYNNAAAHSRRCNGLTLAEQLAVQMIACHRWGCIETVTLTIAAAKAWEVHGLGR
jgi:hypothetical protein